MSAIDVDRMMEDLRKDLESRGVSMQGLSLDELREAMSHPKAAEMVVELMGREAASVQEGDPAPDFSLPTLSGADEGKRVQLADHRGERPVALIFGSYT